MAEIALLHVFAMTGDRVAIVGFSEQGSVVDGWCYKDDPFLLDLTREVVDRLDNGKGKSRPFLGDGTGWVYYG